jgi:hypothetical protein
LFSTVVGVNTWLLVPAAEVGLLARLRPAVRATTSGVLVALDRVPPVSGAQLGLGHAGALRWFGGLSAPDVAAVVALVRRGAFDDLPVALAHRGLTSAARPPWGGN